MNKPIVSSRTSTECLMESLFIILDLAFFILLLKFAENYFIISSQAIKLLIKKSLSPIDLEI